MLDWFYFWAWGKPWTLVLNKFCIVLKSFTEFSSIFNSYLISFMLFTLLVLALFCGLDVANNACIVVNYSFGFKLAFDDGIVGFWGT